MSDNLGYNPQPVTRPYYKLEPAATSPESCSIPGLQNILHGLNPRNPEQRKYVHQLVRANIYQIMGVVSPDLQDSPQLDSASTQFAELLLDTEQENSIDRMTGLYCQNRFPEKLAHLHSWANAQKLELAQRNESNPVILAGLRIDLNGFSNVNNSFGHEAGDKYLQMVGDIINRHTAGLNGAMAGRVGGDEFAIQVPHLSEAEANDLKERINQDFHSGSFDFDIKKEDEETIHKTIHLRRASIGVAMWGSQSLYTAEELDNIADQKQLDEKKRFYNENPQYRKRQIDDQLAIVPH